MVWEAASAFRNLLLSSGVSEDPFALVLMFVRPHLHGYPATHSFTTQWQASNGCEYLVPHLKSIPALLDALLSEGSPVGVHGSSFQGLAHSLSALLILGEEE